LLWRPFSLREKVRMRGSIKGSPSTPALSRREREEIYAVFTGFISNRNAG
jgi:hypothetical protein